MFVRTSTETVLLRKATHLSVFFFHFCRKRKTKKKTKSTELEEERGEEAMERKGRCYDGEGPPGPPLPFSLYEERATGARWLCAFLKHQLPEWSCREAMHCGTGVSNYFFFLPVVIFQLSLVKDLSFHCSWYCGVYRTRFCGDMF